MGQIQVFIPRKGKTVAVPATKAVLWGESLDWHIHCNNKSVKKIKITFDPHKTGKDRPPFFKGKKRKPSDPDHEDHIIIKKITDDGSGNDTRTVNVAGHVPRQPRHTARLDKYIIEGLDGNGKPVPGTKLDPEIITTDPGGD